MNSNDNNMNDFANKEFERVNELWSNNTNYSFTEHMKLKKKEDHRVNTSDHLRRGIKIPMEGDIEIKFGAETEGKAIH